MTQKAMSSMGYQGGTALEEQPTRQPTLAVSALCAALRVDPYVPGTRNGAGGSNVGSEMGGISETKRARRLFLAA